MASKFLSPAGVFAKTLRSFETGGFTCDDVLAQLDRLLTAGASPAELREVLRLREVIEPLPVEAYSKVMGVLEEAIQRSAADTTPMVAPSEHISADSAARPPASVPAPGPRATIRGIVETGSAETVVRDTEVTTPAAWTRAAEPPSAAAAFGEIMDSSGRTVPQDHLSPAPAKGEVLLELRVSRSAGMARVIGASAAILVLIVLAWILGHRAPPPTTASAVPGATIPTAKVPAATAPAAKSPGTLIRDCAACAAVTVLPMGRFKQGAAADDGNALPYERPQHWVIIGRAVAMSTNRVTVDDFRQFIAATGRDMQGCDTYDGAWKNRPENNWQNPGFDQTGTYPVTCVSWNDADAYARWLSTKTGHTYRLPSASEWEYAARAGSEAMQPWTPRASDACVHANVADASAAHQYPGWLTFPCEDGFVNTSPVGSFKANPWGLNDMLGNVFQWTQDCWQADYRGAPVDGSARTDGECSERELRGGSWFTSPAYVRANYRNHFAKDYRTSSVGIRLVRDMGS